MIKQRDQLDAFIRERTPVATNLTHSYVSAQECKQLDSFIGQRTRVVTQRDASIRERTGVINNGGGAFKVAGTVFLSHPTWAESPFFLQTPLVPVQIGEATTLQVRALHPTEQVTYRIGSLSDFGADLSTQVLCILYDDAYIYVCGMTCYVSVGLWRRSHDSGAVLFI